MANGFALAALLGLAATNVTAGNNDLSAVHVEQAWFQPKLLENNDPICESLLTDAQKAFFDNRTFRQSDNFNLAGMKSPYLSPSGELVWLEQASAGYKPVSLYGDEPPLVIDGKAVRLSYYIHSGCGGACERYQLLAFPAAATREQALESDLYLERSPPRTEDLAIYQSSAGDFYQVLLTAEYRQPVHLQAYQLQADASWRKACSIAMEPEASEYPFDGDWEAASNRLLTSAFSVMGGGGRSCGSMRTRDRWRGDFKEGMDVARYRPWFLFERNSAPGETGHAYAFAADLQNIERWALMGPGNWQAYQALNRDLAEYVQALAGFYQKYFGWSVSDAHVAARKAAEGNLSLLFTFDREAQFATDEELQLRRAILTGVPLAEIKAIRIVPQNVKGFSAHRGDSFDESRNESVLNVAVSRPDVLQWLLASGADPDWPNDFGKTPLMYAVQQNQLESVRVLLAAGADVNAATIEPVDDCYYAISNKHLTPLHYAVRFASEAVVSELQQQGAGTWHLARSLHGGMTWNAQQWFIAHQGGADANPHIPVEDHEVLIAALTPPPMEQSLSSVDVSVAKAEKLYQQGEIKASYRLLRDLLSFAPDHQRALRNQALVAQRAGQLGAASQAIASLLKQSDDVNLRAEAHFNQALVCDNLDANLLVYDGERYCWNGALHHLQASLVAVASVPRAQKLADLVQKRPNTCKVKYRGDQLTVLLDDKGATWENSLRRASLYVIHQRDTDVVADDFSWPSRPAPTRVGTFATENGAVTALQVSVEPHQPLLKIGSHICASGQNEGVLLSCMANGTCKTAEEASRAFKKGAVRKTAK